MCYFLHESLQKRDRMRFLNEEFFFRIKFQNLVVLVDEVLPDFLTVGRLVRVDADHRDVHLDKTRLLLATENQLKKVSRRNSLP